MAVSIAGVFALIFAAVLVFVTERQKRRDLKLLREEAQAPFEEAEVTVGDVVVAGPPVATSTLYETMQIMGRASKSGKANRILTNRTIVSYALRKQAERQTA